MVRFFRPFLVIGNEIFFHVASSDDYMEFCTMLLIGKNFTCKFKISMCHLCLVFQLNLEDFQRIVERCGMVQHLEYD